jgi:hypothetical protein
LAPNKGSHLRVAGTVKRYGALGAPLFVLFFVAGLNTLGKCFKLMCYYPNLIRESRSMGFGHLARSLRAASEKMNFPAQRHVPTLLGNTSGTQRCSLDARRKYLLLARDL